MQYSSLNLDLRNSDAVLKSANMFLFFLPLISQLNVQTSHPALVEKSLIELSFLGGPGVGQAQRYFLADVSLFAQTVSAKKKDEIKHCARIAFRERWRRGRTNKRNRKQIKPRKEKDTTHQARSNAGTVRVVPIQARTRKQRSPFLGSGASEVSFSLSIAMTLLSDFVPLSDFAVICIGRIVQICMWKTLPPQPQRTHRRTDARFFQHILLQFNFVIRACAPFGVSRVVCGTHLRLLAPWAMRLLRSALVAESAAALRVNRFLAPTQ